MRRTERQCSGRPAGESEVRLWAGNQDHSVGESPAGSEATPSYWSESPEPVWRGPGESKLGSPRSRRRRRRRTPTPNQKKFKAVRGASYSGKTGVVTGAAFDLLSTLRLRAPAQVPSSQSTSPLCTPPSCARRRRSTRSACSAPSASSSRPPGATTAPAASSCSPTRPASAALCPQPRGRRAHPRRHARLHQGDFGLEVLGIFGFRLAAARAPRLGRHA